MKRILVVEDTEPIRQALAAALACDYDVRVAADGAEAIDALVQEPVDVVLLDLRLPVVDGEGVVEAMARRGIRVPVVLMSAYTDVTQCAQRLSAAAWLKKPFSLGELHAAVSATVGA